jgi:hypothetical protein
MRELSKKIIKSFKIKKIIKNFCPPVLYSYLNNIKNKSTKYKSINELDRKIENYLDYNNGYFVELGANDGISQSNTFTLKNLKNGRVFL